ncbi:MAG: galactose-1-epimerase, partial [Acholeplasmataceae bacterium]
MRIETKAIATSVGETERVTLENDQGMIVELNGFGAAIRRIAVPDEKGDPVDMLVAPETTDDFLTSELYYGKTIGRASGRLFAPSYEIDGRSFPVTPDEGTDTKLHGGPKGFSFQKFRISGREQERDSVSVTFSYLSPDREEGFPGNLHVRITYRLDQKNRLSIGIEGVSDLDTILNVTNHAYFNLSP